MIEKTATSTINSAIITGIATKDFKYSHTMPSGESFYSTETNVLRKSGVADTAPIIVSERIIDVNDSISGKLALISGQIRTHNKIEDGRSRLHIFVFATDIEIKEYSPEMEHDNNVFLDGFICKPPVYRKTPLGREITDMLIAVNRQYGKSDYIPCICWGRSARYAGSFKVGDNVQAWGRIQSREYKKQISDVEFESRIAHELSINQINLGGLNQNI